MYEKDDAILVILLGIIKLDILLWLNSEPLDNSVNPVPKVKVLILLKEKAPPLMVTTEFGITKLDIWLLLNAS